MDDAHLPATVLAVSCAAACTHPVPHPPPLQHLRACREVRKQIAVAAITEVLDRKPLTADHAKMLAHGTLIPARFWLALEDSYRARLAAGKTDVSWDHRPETAQVPFTPLTPDDVARLEPAERLAFTVAASQVARDENPGINTAAVLLLTIQRLITERRP